MAKTETSARTVGPDATLGWGMDPAAYRAAINENVCTFFFQLKKQRAPSLETVDAISREAEASVPPPLRTPAEEEAARLEKLAHELQATVVATAEGKESVAALRAIAAAQENVVTQMEAVSAAVALATAASESERLHEAFTAILPRLAAQVAEVQKALAALDPHAAGFVRRAAELEEQAADLAKRQQEAAAGLRQLESRVQAARQARARAEAEHQAAAGIAVQRHLEQRRQTLRLRLLAAAAPILDELAATEVALYHAQRSQAPPRS